MATELKIENVERSYQLSAGDFGRGWLRQGKTGLTTAWKKYGYLPVGFKTKPGQAPVVTIVYPGSENALTQDVIIATSQTIFGSRPYLTCTCGKRGKLYLRPGVDYWQCRECLNLRYELQRTNRRSLVGMLGYFLNRQLKISALAARVKRVEYRGKVTRSARSLVDLNRKWTLDPDKRARIESMRR